MGSFVAETRTVFVEGFPELLDLLRGHLSDTPPKELLREKLEAAFDYHTPTDLIARAFYDKARERFFKELEL